MCEIRLAKFEEARQIAELHIASWKAAYHDIIPDEILNKQDVEKRNKQFENYILTTPNNFIVVTVNNEIVGFLMIGDCRDDDLSNDVGEIWGIYLHPSFFHKGYGSMLIDYAIIELRGRGFQKACLWVLENNLVALSFYEKHGFVYDGNFEEIIIGKPLIKRRYIKDIMEYEV